MYDEASLLQISNSFCNSNLQYILKKRFFKKQKFILETALCYTETYRR